MFKSCSQVVRDVAPRLDHLQWELFLISSSLLFFSLKKLGLCVWLCVLWYRCVEWVFLCDQSFFFLSRNLLSCLSTFSFSKTRFISQYPLIRFGFAFFHKNIWSNCKCLFILVGILLFYSSFYHYYFDCETYNISTTYCWIPFHQSYFFAPHLIDFF